MMRLKHTHKLYMVFILLLCLLSFGCSHNDSSMELPHSASDHCPVSPIRTGTKRQNIYALENGFECTKDGAYFMSRVGESCWLLYIDHSSDTVIKLCGRPDCGHDHGDCNAYFKTGVNICYYNGYLYTYGGEQEKGLIRLNLDGSERITVYNLSDFMTANQYKGVSYPRIWNGIFTFGLKKLGENGKELVHSYYYKLDGSMNEPQMTSGIGNIRADGDNFVGMIGFDSDTKEYIYGRWNPEDGSTSELFRDKEKRFLGYFGNHAEYYIQDGIIYENTYTDGKKVFFDTGLRGNFQLAMFPDCFVVSDYVTAEDLLTGGSLDHLTLRFYDWKFHNLGSAKIDFPLEKLLPGVICGETHERIYLTDSHSLVPKYYIDKADFGNQDIRIHALKTPAFD